MSGLSSAIYAQRKSVLIEPQSRKINQGNPLPSQTYFDLQIPVDSKTGVVTVDIYTGRVSGRAFEHSYWVRPVNFNGNLAELPVNSRLKSSNNYTFKVAIYAELDDAERSRLKELIEKNITNYLDAVFKTDKGGIAASRRQNEIINDLDNIVKSGTTNYQNVQQKEFEGFSDIVSLKLKQVVNAKLKDANYNMSISPEDSLKTNEQIKAAYADTLTTELLTMVLNEANNYLDLDFLKLHDSFVVENQYTEKLQTVLPLFVGYGGVYLGGDIKDLEYDSQPYVGMAFPLGRGNQYYYSRTSFILGVFINNLKDGDGKTITGPIVNRPVFAGLGFRVFEFINLNAGVVATSDQKQSLSNFKTENVKLQPFIGLNAQFNLWLGLNKK